MNPIRKEKVQCKTVPYEIIRRVHCTFSSPVNVRSSENLEVPAQIFVNLWLEQVKSLISILTKLCLRLLQCCAETGRSYTYSNLRILCARFGRALRKQKFQRGQTLSIVLPNIPEYPIILLGAVEAGLTVSTLNPNFKPGNYSER